MKTLAFTVIQNDMVMLELWLKYYRRHFDKLVVVKWLTKKKYEPFFRKLEKRYSVEFLPMGEEEILRYGSHVGTRMFLQKKQAEFLDSGCNWVLFCNLDEILVPKKGTLRRLMKESSKEWIACEGFEVIRVDGEKPISYSRPYFKQRKYWIRNQNYNKIILSKVYLDWVDGMHKLAKMTDDESRAIKNTGLYLVHLKHADLKPVGKRDFGPHQTILDPNIMEHWIKYKKPIPEQVRKAL